MGEILITKVRSLYGEIKGLHSGLPKQVSGPYCIPSIIGERFNTALDLLTQASNTDYSRFKILRNELSRAENCNIRVIEPLMSTIITKLENEYGFGSVKKDNSANIVIINKNTNEVSVNVDYTIEDLIRQSNGQATDQLTQLKNELDKDDKNWETIKGCLLWILNFSKDLFFKILPLLLGQKIS